MNTSKKRSTKKKSGKQPRSTTKSQNFAGWVVKYIAEGPEREDFYQGDDKFNYQLNEATLFRSLEVAQLTANRLNEQCEYSSGPNSYVVLEVRDVEVAAEATVAA